MSFPKMSDFDLKGKKIMIREDFNVPLKNGVISLFLNAYRNDKPLIVFGDGMQSRDFIHVRDVARANLLALKKSNQDVVSAVNIATGKAETILQLIAFIEAAGKKKAQIQFAAERSGDIKNSYANVDRAAKLLEFRYSIELETGIKTMVGGEP